MDKPSCFRMGLVAGACAAAILFLTFWPDLPATQRVVPVAMFAWALAVAVSIYRTGDTP